MAIIDDITDFLPIYPYIADDNFYTDLYEKKEFYEDKLGRVEDMQNLRGGLLRHQRVVARFMSPRTPYPGVLLYAQMGSGKCFLKDTPIMLFSGETKLVQDIEIGDMLMGDDSTPRTVTSLARGEDDMYDIVPIKGDKYTVNKEHILCLKMSSYPALYSNKVYWLENNKFCSKTFRFQRSNKEDKILKEKEAIEFRESITSDQILEISVKDFLKLPKNTQATLKTYRVPVEFPEQIVPIDPYLIGLWLGDGDSNGSGITTQDSRILDYLNKNLRQYSLLLNFGRKYHYTISGYTGKVGSNVFLTALKENNLIKNKHIPAIYKYNSRENRLKLLAGLIDTDGNLTGGGFEFTQKNERLMDDVVFLARSLGFSCYKHIKKTSWTHKGIKKYGEALRIFIFGEGIEDIPTLILRKQATQRKQVKDVLVSSITVNYVGKDNYYGFTVDGNSRFLLSDFTVTHNSLSSIAAIENVRESDSTIDGAVVCARGEGLLENFRSEIIKYYPKYLPDNALDLTEGELASRTKRLLRQFYMYTEKPRQSSFGFTFLDLAKQLTSMSDTDIKQKFSNKIIVVDEVHNIRHKENEGKTQIYVYGQFHRLLHTAQNIKVLLLSGTPIRDSIDEFADVMNLLLPTSDQLPTGSKFLEEYFNLSDGSYLLKPDKIPEMKRRMKGRVSYLRVTTSEVPKIFIGEKVGDLKYLTVYPVTMSNHQSVNYAKYYQLDTNTSVRGGEDVEVTDNDTKESGIYNTSRQASLFVFPDGSQGGQGFNKYVEKKYRVTRESIIKRGGISELQEKRVAYYKLTTEFEQSLRTGTENDPYAGIRKYSAIYADAIEKIIKNANDGKAQFVFCQYIHGSGAILFGLILNLFGFAPAEGDVVTPGRRYILLNTVSAPTPSLRRKLKDRFNKPDNLHGRYINLIIGSSVVSEGYSFSNIQVEYIFTPFWNYSVTDQAIARGYRFGSHRGLIAEGMEPKLEIYQYVALPEAQFSDGIESIDLKMYETSEKKDVSIKHLERIAKEAAVDCALNYDRNLVTGYDGERECDYGQCEYSCDGVPARLYKPEDESSDSESDDDVPIQNLRNLRKLKFTYSDSDEDGAGVEPEQVPVNYSTYQLYYANDEYKKLTSEILQLFQSNFRISYTFLKQKFSNITDYMLLTVLRQMIDMNTPVRDRYGRLGYLREDNNTYFISSSLVSGSGYLSSFYTENLIITKPATYDEVLSQITVLTAPNFIQHIFTLTDRDAIKTAVNDLSIDIREVLLEGCILAKIRETTKGQVQRNIILEILNDKITEVENVYYSTLVTPTRCLDRLTLPHIWRDCTSEQNQLYTDFSKNRLKLAADSGLGGYYGTFNGDKFCIVKPQVGAINANNVNSGVVCGTGASMKKKDLVRLSLTEFRIPTPDVNDTSVVRNREVWNLVLQKTTAGLIAAITAPASATSELYTRDQLEKLSMPELQRIAYWAIAQNNTICSILRNFFASRNALIPSKNCGTARKKKTELV